ncbi:S8 family serine peptidase [Halobellus sp. GM3]|uniref:S8 family serine peptidase n=1 Tax=Halobellus sp. GM3 TaxID=3458410 RepID=UPI00403DF42A
MTPGRRDRAEFRISRRRALAIGGTAAVSVVSTSGVPKIGGSTPTRDADRTADGTEPISRVHEAGITGDGVRTAVIDPTGFDPSHTALDGAIEDIRQFGPEAAVVDGTSHGTAAAASVVRLAPDARLSLASFQRTDGFLAAIEWARRGGADVILAPVAAHGTAATPRSDVFESVRRAVEAGCAFVSPTGNAALGHWEGPRAALVGDSPGTRRRLRVRPLPGSDAVAGRLVAWLVADPAIETELTLALLRAVDSGSRWNLVALSQSVDSRVGQRLVADLADDEYALVVRPAGRGSPGQGPIGGRNGADDTRRVEVVTPTHALSPSRSLGSIAAPATVPGVVGVGVTAPPDGDSPGAVAPYSGRGPTPRGDVGVDVVAPPSPWVGDGEPGTSAAAARTAGAAALVLDAAPRLGPEGVAEVLRASAGDVGRPGRDLASGSGRLDVVAAVQRARAR